MARQMVKLELARELHDTVAQPLTNALVEMRCLRADQDGRGHTAHQLDHLESTMRTAVRNLRTVLLDLREQPTAVSSFIDAVNVLLRNFTELTGIAARLIESASWPATINGVAAYNLTRVLEEALANVRAHSEATRVDVELGVHPGDHLFFEVRDNGHGTSPFSSIGNGLGMTGMFERVTLLGGELTVSSKESAGMTLAATFQREDVQ